MSAPSSPECLPTSGESSFRDLIHRLRTGEGPAAKELVRRYGPYVRRVARYRMRSMRRLGRLFDSEDFCQMVFDSFFLRLADGQYELDAPGKLLALLKAMTGNKVKDQARRLCAARRQPYRPDRKGVADGEKLPDLFKGQLVRPYRPDRKGVADGEPIALGESPSQQAIFEELMTKVMEQLTEEELRLAELRAAGVAWEVIAQQTGDSPEALRKRLDRAIQRVQAWLQARS